eukprot:TRINITY_DN4705_c0_g1_i1.p1 TRINITY_DN4705_c0_g1~~TRINITY_DN4705_c0_g1_i1.p1  ORF type:complete len:405 (+),score=73.89 TRINITY_DN4705_c0_g1_i1:78-1292(+)
MKSSVPPLVSRSFRGSPAEDALEGAAPRMPLRTASFDSRDLAPEDAFQKASAHVAHAPPPAFDPYAPVVRCGLRLEGVNFARVEAAKGRRVQLERFLDALRDDIIAEVGNGVRREDILFRVTPGEIRHVVLSFEDSPKPPLGGTEKRAHLRSSEDSSRSGRSSKGVAGEVPEPKLLDADWAVLVDCAIRCRSVTSQRTVAQSLYNALAEGLVVAQTREVYLREIDPQASRQHCQLRIISAAVPQLAPQEHQPAPQPIHSTAVPAAAAGAAAPEQRWLPEQPAPQWTTPPAAAVAPRSPGRCRRNHDHRHCRHRHSLRVGQEGARGPLVPQPRAGPSGDGPRPAADGGGRGVAVFIPERYLSEVAAALDTAAAQDADGSSLGTPPPRQRGVIPAAPQAMYTWEAQ